MLLCIVRVSFLILASTIALTLMAQERNGMVNDNYAGRVAGLYNPANLADSRFKFNMHVVGFNAHLQQNYLQLEPSHSIYKFLNLKLDSNFGTQNFDYPFDQRYIKERLNGRDKFLFTNASVDLLSFQIGLKNRSTFSFGLTTRVYANVSNLPEDAIKTFLQDLDEEGNPKKNQIRILNDDINVKNAGIAALAYQQYSFKYAFVALDKRSDFLKVGVGLDYNLGLSGGFIRIKDLNYKVIGTDTIRAENAEIEVGYVNPDYLSDPARRAGDFFGSSRLGRGIGVNVGVVYEHRPNNKTYQYKMDRKRLVDNSENKYDWKVGASIVNFGFVNFNNQEANRYSSLNITGSTQWNNYDSADTWSTSSDIDSFSSSFFSEVENDSSFMMFTPATLHLSADYKIKKYWYLSANYTQSLIRNSSRGVRMPNVLSVAPRYERRWFAASIPVAVSRYYNVINIGAYLRAGAFYMGSDNLGGFFTGHKTNGANIYAGFNWPIHYKKLEDMDSDGVSDELDECPATAGSRYTDGCPDSDGDKVADDEDLCPGVAGTKRTDGCPDTDKDGTADRQDKCPQVYGSKKHSGCPDTDGDGVYDGEDKCPQIVGKLEYNGCIDAVPLELIADSSEGLKEIIIEDNNAQEDAKSLEDLDDKSTVKNVSSPKETKVETVANRVESIDTAELEDWDFDSYVYWPVLGSYNEMKWAKELQARLNRKFNLGAEINTIAGMSKYYVTLGKAKTLEEVERTESLLDLSAVNNELNGKLWWKKVAK